MTQCTAVCHSSDRDACQRLEVSTSEYLADPAPQPSLSSSIAKVLLDQSPAHARLVHPRLGGSPHESTAATDMGALIHRLVLGKGAEIECIDAEDYRTKAAQQARDAARKQGRIPALSRVMSEAAAAAAIIRRALAGFGVQLNGESEVAMMWQEAAEHGDIWCRAMLDHVVPRDGVLRVYDLKTIHSAHPDDCTRSAINYGYDVQQAAYTRAAETLWPEYAGRVEFQFLFCETRQPFAVTVAELDATMRERGRRRWVEAVETWSRCLYTDNWPTYAQQPVTLWSPGWLLQRESEAAAARGEDLVFYGEE